MYPLTKSYRNWILRAVALLAPITGLIIWRFVRMITNDLGRFKPKTAQEVFEGYVEFVETMRASLPQTPIYYIAITPTPSRWKTWPTVQEANQLIKAYTETDHQLHFIDMTNQYLGPDGRPKRDLYIWDRLHPSAKGYALWTSIIKPRLEADLSFPAPGVNPVIIRHVSELPIVS